MSSTSISDKYDAFQAEAVGCLVRDFSKKSNGRYLLVIPTGGGKTYTAVKSINALYSKSILDINTDRVLWIAHRVELINQAKVTLERYEHDYPGRPSCRNSVDLCMLAGTSSAIKNSKIKLVVIDEAHHAAANSYLPIFGKTKLGVLGLTATPSRHDGKPLEFERESFSIGFPELVELGVILRPEVRTVEGGEYSFSLDDGDDGLEQLNNAERNRSIIEGISRHHDDYKKVIIYVGTVSHVEALYKAILTSRLAAEYQSISYIHGKGNSRGQEREQFLETERSYSRSIIVNVDVLSEGYDDPTVNTVVMASPTRSKLRYMQAMGRAIRHDPDPDNDLKKAYVVEVDDTLPNIRYRIDNRWLYADISDALEPKVRDVVVPSLEKLKLQFGAICKEFNVPANQQQFPTLQTHNRYSLLLFKVYKGPNNYAHYPIFIDNDNRQSVSNAFNFLSARMESFASREINSEVAFGMIDVSGIQGLREKQHRAYVYGAMENAASSDESCADGSPWITFISFRVNRPENELPEEILEFTRDMINREEVLETIRSGLFPASSFLVKLPLPLSSSVGKIMSSAEIESMQDAISQLENIKVEQGNQDHRAPVSTFLGDAVLPIGPAYGSSLMRIVRDSSKWFLPLD